MHRFHVLALCMMLTGGLAWLGCGSANSGSGAPDATAAPRDTREPKQVLTDFLQLKKQGNHAEADKLLSDKAREVITNAHRVFTPPADDAVYTELGEVQLVQGNGAHVPIKWSQGEGTEAVCLELTWVLRNDPQGWRIVGLIGKFDPNTAENVALDFEDQAQFLSLLSYAEAPPGQVAKQDETEPIEMAKQPR